MHLRHTPVRAQPGRYETPISAVTKNRSGDSTAGSAAFVGVHRVLSLTGPQDLSTPGPGTHRPEEYGAIGARPVSAPRVATLAALRKPVVTARLEVRTRGTPPSIPPATCTSFSYEEDETGAVRPIRKPAGVPPAQRVGPGLYSPQLTNLSKARTAQSVDFASGSGRAYPAATAGHGAGVPPALTDYAPDWHDGATSNPLPAHGSPSSSFAVPSHGAVHGAPPSPSGSPSRGTCRSSHTAESEGGGAGVFLPTGGQHASRDRVQYVTQRAAGGPATSHGAGASASDASHANRHSRGRARGRAVLVASVGVADARGGLLGRQLLSRQRGAIDVPGPGTHEAAKGVGASKPVPASGLPRPRPFYAAHLRALGSFVPNAVAMPSAPSSSAPRTTNPATPATPAYQQAWGGSAASRGSSAHCSARSVTRTVTRAESMPAGMATPTAHLISYAR
jgi:hypothetical protein